MLPLADGILAVYDRSTRTQDRRSLSKSHHRLADSHGLRAKRSHYLKDMIRSKPNLAIKDVRRTVVGMRVVVLKLYCLLRAAHVIPFLSIYSYFDPEEGSDGTLWNVSVEGVRASEAAETFEEVQTTAAGVRARCSGAPRARAVGVIGCGPMQM
ncbi:hypothetical protein J6590_079088 [Homalodisca vitripennis]|nr:hypothetical protein J6590_079088 [Homalodisca vitripennis]